MDEGPKKESVDIRDLPMTPPRRSSTYDSQDALGSIIGMAVAGVFVVIVWKIFERAGKDQQFYGYALFSFAPFLAGFVNGVFANWKKTGPAIASWISALMLFTIGSVALMICAVEGMVCIVMAAPLTIPLMALGVFAGRGLMAATRRPNRRRILVSAAPVLVATAFTSAAYEPGMATKKESTTIIVDAPPEKIWPYLFHLDGLPKPDQWIFRTGIAYTTGTDSGGQKAGSSRRCLLTTGVMNERISELETNRHLRFEVLNTPPSMKESNPFFEIHPRHERDCFKVHWGEFRLEPLPGGRTKFTGTSCYSYSIYPAWYWGLYTDTVAEQIHVRMMGEIKKRVESRSEPYPGRQ